MAKSNFADFILLCNLSRVSHLAVILKVPFYEVIKTDYIIKLTFY
ncbi:hypothetical protein ACWIUD_08945 [Helicobacter sp. 23-1044]